MRYNGMIMNNESGGMRQGAAVPWFKDTIPVRIAGLRALLNAMQEC
jgi:hypothetical protein